MATVVPYPPVPPAQRSDLPPLGPGAVGSIGARIVARVIDMFVVLVPLSFVTVWPFTVESVGGTTVTIDQPPWALVVQWVVPVAYEIVMLMFFGATIGKFVARLRVVRFSDGRLPQPTQASYRTLVPALPTLVALVAPDSLALLLSPLPTLIYLTALFNPLFRGLNDRAGGTIVLRYR